METLITIIFTCAAIVFIGIIKFKDHKNKKENPPRQWEGKKQIEMEQHREKVEKLTEFQKGNGRAGGPF